MTSQRSRGFLVFCSTLALASGCSQIIGVGDYTIDPKLDPTSQAGSPQGGVDGGGGDAGGDGGVAGTAGSSGNAGQPTGGQGGEPPNDPGGAGGQGVGGEGGSAGAGGAGEVVIPCESLNCCAKAGGRAEGVELLQDGGFELGAVADGMSPWTESSAKGFPLITDGTVEDATPHGGSYLAFLAGVKSETSLLQSEALLVPPDAGWMVLSGYRLFEIDSESGDTTNTDSMSLSLWDADDPLEIPFYWDNTNPGQTATWAKFEATWDAEPHQGTVRYLYALGSTDDYVTNTDGLASSNYMIDDLSLKAFRCISP